MLLNGLNLKAGEVVHFFKGDHASLVEPTKGHAREAYSLDLDKISLHANSKLVLLTAVSSQTGLKLNIGKWAKRLKELDSSVHIHVDAVQSFGKVSDFEEWKDVDSITLSSHKIGGPKGVAALVIKKSIKLAPLLLGGGHELNLRASSVNAPAIFGFEKAAEICSRDLNESLSKAFELNEYLSLIHI